MNKEEGLQILKDLRALQSELDLAKVHCIELQKRVMVLSGVDQLE